MPQDTRLGVVTSHTADQSFERAAAKQKLVEAAFPLWERAAVACKDCIQSNAGINQGIFCHLINLTSSARLMPSMILYAPCQIS